MEEALRLIGLPRENLLIIGDHYDTDVKAGMNANIDILMVLTGFSTLANVQDVEKQPTYIREILLNYFNKDD